MRAFVAVDVSAIDQIAKLQNSIASSAGWGAAQVKPVEPQNFHFTLIFLGEITDADILNIKERLSRLQFEPVKISYVSIGAFPRAEAARLVWAGVDREGAQKLSELAQTVALSLAELGFRPDKPFSPHLTIFRVKGRQPLNMSSLVKRYNEHFADDIIDKVHLKKSELTPSGPIYSNVYTVEAGN